MLKDRIAILPHCPRGRVGWVLSSKRSQRPGDLFVPYRRVGFWIRLPGDRSFAVMLRRSTYA